jgi:hypothetical protein
MCWVPHPPFYKSSLSVMETGRNLYLSIQHYSKSILSTGNLHRVNPTNADAYKTPVMKNGSDTINPPICNPHENDIWRTGAAPRAAKPSKTAIDVNRIDSWFSAMRFVRSERIVAEYPQPEVCSIRATYTTLASTQRHFKRQLRQSTYQI